MPYTLAQKNAIIADIAANPDLNAQPPILDGSYEIARLYNLPSNPVLMVWRTDAPVQDIFDAVDMSKYTPTDVPAGIDLPAVSATWLNRAHSILIKQSNLLAFLRLNTINFSKANIRAGIRDAVIALPAGANGANVTAGGASGATVLVAGTRVATRLEKLLTAGPAITGTTTADVMGWEGKADPVEIQAVRVN